MEDTDKKYPIYSISARWIQDGEQDPKYPKWFEGLPEGRIFNSASYNRMLKDESEAKDLEKEAREWWAKYKGNEKNKDKNFTDCVITITFVRNESWMLEWFCHSTPDVGQSDADVVASFQRYVQRMEIINSRSADPFHPEVCLMGAEDRWRWHGEGQDGPVPCRCEGCKKSGVIRIGH